MIHENTLHRRGRGVSGKIFDRGYWERYPYHAGVTPSKTGLQGRRNERPTLLVRFLYVEVLQHTPMEELIVSNKMTDTGGEIHKQKRPKDKRRGKRMKKKRSEDMNVSVKISSFITFFWTNGCVLFCLLDKWRSFSTCRFRVGDETRRCPSV